MIEESTVWQNDSHSIKVTHGLTVISTTLRHIQRESTVQGGDKIRDSRANDWGESMEKECARFDDFITVPITLEWAGVALGVFAFHLGHCFLLSSCISSGWAQWNMVWACGLPWADYCDGLKKNNSFWLSPHIVTHLNLIVRSSFGPN